MASILSAHGSGDVFACANPKDTMLNNPIDLPPVFTDPFLSNPSTTTNPLDIFLANAPSSQPFDSFPSHNQSSLFSYDGAPSSQYQQGPSLADPPAPGQGTWELPLHHHHHHSPTSNEDDHYETTTASKSPSPTTQKKPTGRKPGRRPSKQHDEQREKFLEKNRIAANKHRKRKKEFIQTLESRYKEQSDLKNSLKEEVSRLRGEALDLQEALFLHAECDNGPIRDYINKKIGGMYKGKPLAIDQSDLGLVGPYLN